MALTGCELDKLEILTRLNELIADPEKPVRIDSAQAHRIIVAAGRSAGLEFRTNKAE